ncbi:MAG: AsmA family protein, partial [Stellaceae bacterium]
SSTVKGTAQGSFQDLPVKLAAAFGPLGELRNPAKPYPVKLNGSWGQVDLAITGTIQKPLDFNGLDLRLSLSGNKLDEIASALGVPMPALPTFRGTSKLTGGNGHWQLGALTVKVGNSDLEGGIAIDTNETVPHLTANLTSSEIDLADFKGLYGGHPEKSATPPPFHPEGRIIPDTKIAVKKLPDIDLTLKFYGTRIRSTGGLPFERIVFGIRIEKGQLIVDPLTFHVALGDVALKARFNPFTRTTPPKLSGKVQIQHIDLHRLLQNMPPIVRQTAGTAGGFLLFDTTGASFREFMAHMNGDFALFVANGQVSDLLQHLAPIDVLESLGVLALGDQP